MPELNIVMKDVDPFKALSIKLHGSTENVRKAREEMLETLAKLGIKKASPKVDVIYGDEINLEDLEFAFAIPVDNSVTEDVELPTQDTLTKTEA